VADVFLLDPELETELRAAGLCEASDLLEWGGRAEAHRVGERISLRLGSRTLPAYLKRYAYAGWRAARGLIGRGSLWGVAPEINEFRALTWLRAQGLPAVRPLAAASRQRAGRLVAHALLTEVVPDALDLAARVRLPDDPFVREPGLRRAVLERVAGALAQMHAAGFVHRDCHARNLLVRTGPEQPEIWFLDCRRGGIGGRKGPAYDLATLDQDLRGHLSRSERLRALRTYAPERSARRVLQAQIATIRAALPPARG
jgi:tRNA A-37 threonylcarbamoyl transferase component Bud32